MIRLLAATALSFSLMFGVEIIMEDNFQPFTYTEKGQAKGLYVDIIKKAMKIVGEEQEIKAYPFARGIEMLKNKQNIAMFAIIKTKEREELFKWACPVDVSETYIAKLTKSKAPDVKSLDEIEKLGLKVGTVYQWAAHKFLMESGFKNIEITNIKESLVKMQEIGRIDYITLGAYDIENPEMFGLKKGDFTTMFELYKSIKCLSFSKDVPDSEVKKWEDALHKVTQKK